MRTKTCRLHAIRWLSLFLLFALCCAGRGHAADARSDFLKLIERPRVALAPEVAARESRDAALEEFHFSYAADANSRVPGILVKQKTGEEKAAPGAAAARKPAVIALHGTGGYKEDQRSLLVALAKRGFVAVAIDSPYHGERTKAGRGSREYEQAILRVWRENGSPDQQSEHPFFFDTVWDVMRLVDYLETRDDVDAKRIGLVGISKGGVETYLTAAVDPRIAVAVPCIGMQSFAWAADNGAWQSRIETVQTAFDAAAKEAGVTAPGGEFVHEFYRRVAPGLDGEFDGPAMAALVAPRPLMLINGDSDARTPLAGLTRCTDAAEAAYHAAGANERFLVRIQPHTGHRVNADSRAAAIEWFAKWLGP